jgi:hypothetical protein
VSASSYAGVKLTDTGPLLLIGSRNASYLFYHRIESRLGIEVRNRGATIDYRLPIDVLPMAYSDDLDLVSRVIDNVQDPKIADPQSILIPSAELLTLYWPRICL